LSVGLVAPVVPDTGVTGSEIGGWLLKMSGALDDWWINPVVPDPVGFNPVDAGCNISEKEIQNFARRKFFYL